MKLCLPKQPFKNTFEASWVANHPSFNDRLPNKQLSGIAQGPYDSFMWQLLALYLTPLAKQGFQCSRDVIVFKQFSPMQDECSTQLKCNPYPSSQSFIVKTLQYKLKTLKANLPNVQQLTRLAMHTLHSMSCFVICSQKLKKLKMKNKKCCA